MPEGLRLHLLLEAVEDGRGERRGASRRLALGDTEFTRHALEAALLGEDVGDLRICSLVDVPGSSLAVGA